MTAPWTNTARNPSRLGARPEATPAVLRSMGAGSCDAVHIQAFVDNQHTGDIIIQSAAGGFTNGRFVYHSEMQMSYAHAGQDHVIWSRANEDVMAAGRVMRIRCDGEMVHLAHWPTCGNLSRVYPLWEPLPIVPEVTIPPWFFDAPPEPYVSPDVPENTVPEPGTLALMLLGVFLLALMLRRSSHGR